MSQRERSNAKTAKPAAANEQAARNEPGWPLTLEPLDDDTSCNHNSRRAPNTKSSGSTIGKTSSLFSKAKEKKTPLRADMCKRGFSRNDNAAQVASSANATEGISAWTVRLLVKKPGARPRYNIARGAQSGPDRRQLIHPRAARATKAHTTMNPRPVSTLSPNREKARRSDATKAGG